MTQIVALLLSTAALAVAGWALLWVRSLDSEQRALRQLSAELQGRLLLNQARPSAAAAQARLDVTLEQGQDGEHRFVVRNVSKVAAHNVYFQLLDCPASILVHEDYKTKIPIQILQPGDAVDVLASIGAMSPKAFKARVRFKHPDDTVGDEIYTLIATEQQEQPNDA